jgi:hypothetical protein
MGVANKSAENRKVSKSSGSIFSCFLPINIRKKRHISKVLNEYVPMFFKVDLLMELFQCPPKVKAIFISRIYSDY